MLQGQSRLQELIPELPEIKSFDVEPVELAFVEILQVQYEIASANIESLLPTALHPTIPPLGLWSCWDVHDSPWGAFRLAQFRISCRSGARPRTFLLGSVVNNGETQQVLASRWGFNAKLGEIDFVRGYEMAEFQIQDQDKTVLNARTFDPESLTANDIQFFATMHGAMTPKGLRLVQFDPSFEVHRAERYQPNIDEFDGAYWGSPLISPSYPVIAWGANATIHLPKIRFLCRPDVDAFAGTEVVS